MRGLFFIAISFLFIITTRAQGLKKYPISNSAVRFICTVM